MLTHSFQDLQLSALGFGTMRLPTDESGEIDQAQLDRMVDTAIASGINYFDTAYPYITAESLRSPSVNLSPAIPERAGIWRINSPAIRMSRA